MSLKLKVDPPPDREWYTSGDKFSGTVVLDASRSSGVSSVVVSLYGITYTHLEQDFLTNTGGAECQASETEFSTVLDEMQQVFPTQALQSGSVSYTLSQGKHEFPFSFTLPLYAVPQGDIGSKARQALVLPPSVSDEGDTVLVQYFVKVKCKREGLFSSLSETQYFAFLPCDQFSSQEQELEMASSVSSRGVVSSNQNFWGLFGGKGREKPCYLHQFVLYCKPVFTPNIKNHVDVELKFLRDQPIVVTQIKVSLQVCTTAKAKNLNKTLERNETLYKNKQPIFLDDTSGQASVLSTDVEVSGKIVPDFYTSQMHRYHFLLVQIEYKHQRASSSASKDVKHSATLKLPVVVRSGITMPDWETKEVTYTPRTFPQHSIYYTKRDRGVIQSS